MILYAWCWLFTVDRTAAVWLIYLKQCILLLSDSARHRTNWEGTDPSKTREQTQDHIHSTVAVLYFSPLEGVEGARQGGPLRGLAVRMSDVGGTRACVCVCVHVKEGSGKGWWGYQLLGRGIATDDVHIYVLLLFRSTFYSMCVLCVICCTSCSARQWGVWFLCVCRVFKTKIVVQVIMDCWENIPGSPVSVTPGPTIDSEVRKEIKHIECKYS